MVSTKSTSPSIETLVFFMKCIVFSWNFLMKVFKEFMRFQFSSLMHLNCRQYNFCFKFLRWFRLALSPKIHYRDWVSNFILAKISNTSMTPFNRNEILSCKSNEAILVFFDRNCPRNYSVKNDFENLFKILLPFRYWNPQHIKLFSS